MVRRRSRWRRHRLRCRQGPARRRTRTDRRGRTAARPREGDRSGRDPGPSRAIRSRRCASSRDKADAIAWTDQRRRIPRAVKDADIGAPDQPPAARRVEGIYRRLPVRDRDRSRGDPFARTQQARRDDPRIKKTAVRESWEEPEEERAVLAPGVQRDELLDREFRALCGLEEIGSVVMRWNLDLATRFARHIVAGLRQPQDRRLGRRRRQQQRVEAHDDRRVGRNRTPLAPRVPCVGERTDPRRQGGIGYLPGYAEEASW